MIPDDAMLKTTSAARTVAITTTSRIVLEQNLKRLSFWIASPVAQAVLLCPAQTAAAGQGLNIAVGAFVDPLTIYDWGDAIRRDWSAIVSAGTETLLIIEVLAAD